jgi:uncharacterized protein YcbX
MSDRSLAGLVGFLDWTADKGIMAKNTVNGRKAAVSSVLGILDPEEQGDITAIDLDSVMTRFVNLQGKKYNTSSLNVYKSRTNAAINDFKAWLADPLSFKPNGNKAEKKASPKPAKKAGATLQSAALETPPNVQMGQAQQSTSANVFPIQIRENLVVRIHGLPFDLTKPEAERIANVVRAMAMG